MARGVDDRPVRARRGRKSCSIEDTFPIDLHTRREALGQLERLAGRLEERLLRLKDCGRTLTLTVKYADFTRITRSKTLGRAIRDRALLLAVASDLLEGTEVGRRPVRLLGIGVSGFAQRPEQLVFPFYREELAQPVAR